MEKIRNYDISFSGLSIGNHEFDFEITQSFFDLFAFKREFEKADIKVDMQLEKKANMLEFSFFAKGYIVLLCDISGTEYNQEIEGSLNLIVKFGNDFDDTDDEVWIIPHGDYKFNIAQLIYELIILNIPTKHINPNLSNEELNEIQDLLESYSPKEISKEVYKEEKKDPRWDELKKLLDN